jgi:hypothetical protein
MFRTVLSSSQPKNSPSSTATKTTATALKLKPLSSVLESRPLIPSPDIPQGNTNRSPTRYGLFRRKLMDEPSTTSLRANSTSTGTIDTEGNGGIFAKVTLGNIFRGGATGRFSIVSTTFQTIFVESFCRFANFVGQTKARCFCLLVFSVIIESYATTLSKQAKDTGNALLFARACLVYLFWYVHLA